MEKFTEKELEQLKKLQAKQKRIQREKSSFKKQVLDNKQEVIKILELDKACNNYYENKLNEISTTYGMTIDTLLDTLNDENIRNTIMNLLKRNV